MDLHVRFAHLERLGIGVHGDELDAGDTRPTMRDTAFVPAPPTPTTLMTARKFPDRLLIATARDLYLSSRLRAPRVLWRFRVRTLVSAVNGR